jgi:competence protein ComEA
MDQSAAPWRALENDEPVTGDAARAPRSPGATRTTWIAAAVGGAALVAGLAIWLVATNGSGSLVVEGGGPLPAGSDRAIGRPDRSPSSASGGDLVVDVQGAVVRPGIVRVPSGSRIADAIAAAGGYGRRVAADRVGQNLNLAALLKDGDQVIVPSRDDLAAGPSPRSDGPGTTAAGGSGPIDLNHATAAELDGLPGIGPVTAAKIIAARDEQAFASVDDLRTRKILGQATFDKVKSLVVVR